MKLIETKRRIEYSASYTVKELEEMFTYANLAYNIAQSTIHNVNPHLKSEALAHAMQLYAFKEKLLMDLRLLKDAETTANIP